MRVAIDVSPLRNGHFMQHSVRGTGFYLTNLLSALKKNFPQVEFIEFTRGDSLSHVDIIHYPYFEPFFRTLPLSYKAPSVVTVHDVTPLRFPDLFPPGIKGKLKWQMQRYALQKASHIITDSEHSKKDIHEIASIPQQKISAIPLAAAAHFKKVQYATDERKKILKKFNLPEKFALYVGDATPNKNLPVLIKAVEISHVPLVMVGKALSADVFDKSHPWNKDLVLVKEKTKNNPLFHILGFLQTNDLVALYNMSSVFVFPSFYEGFGLPVIEAMSCGAPIITTRSSSLPEVGGEAVVYVDENHPKSFADQIDRIVASKETAKALSEKSLIQAKKFSWDITAEKTMKVYQSL